MDSVTQGEYDSAATADARAQVVLTALTGSTVVQVRNGSTVVGSGNMEATWAVRSGSVLTVGETSNFQVTSSGTPSTATWTCRFVKGTRWIQGSFGLPGAGGDFTWSLSSWTSGQLGTLGTVAFTATAPAAPPPPPPPPPPEGTVTFQEDFSSGVISSTKFIIVKEAASPSPDVGNYFGSLRCRHRILEQPAPGPDYRCELRVRNSEFDKKSPVRGQELWFGYRLRLQSHPTNTANGGWPAENYNCIVMQLHKGVTNATAKQPPAGLCTNSGRWLYERNWSIDGTQGSKKEFGYDLGSYTNDIDRDLDWVFHWKLDWIEPENGGIARNEVWKNGVKVIDDNEPNYYNGDVTGFIKIGIYASQRQFNPGVARTVYTDRIRAAAEGANFSLVNPAAWGT
jgi:hypothetical protein